MHIKDIVSSQKDDLDRRTRPNHGSDHLLRGQTDQDPVCDSFFLKNYFVIDGLSGK